MVNYAELRMAFRKERRLLSLNPPIKSKEELTENEDQVLSGCTFGWCLLLATFIFIGGCIVSSQAHADVIDMHKIMMIESGGRNVASTIKSEHAIGIYQITPVVLKEFNAAGVSAFPLVKHDLYNTTINLWVATWYLNKRIPQMLRAYKKPVTTRNIIIAYNAGISYVVKNKALPRRTMRYLEKYGD